MAGEKENDELRQHVLMLEKEAESHKQTEASLRRSNQFINSILAASPVGIGLVEHRIIKRVNDSMTRLFRFDSEADYMGKSARILYPTEEEFEDIGQFIYSNLQVGKEAQLDANFRRKDGTTFYGHLKVSTLDPSSPMRLATFTISDISWRKKAETELLQKEKLQAVIETAGAVCHELNQPMQIAVMDLIELSQTQEGCVEAVKTRLEKIKKQFDSMRDITRKLMRITRYETRDYVEGEKIIDIDKAAGLKG